MERSGHNRCSNSDYQLKMDWDKIDKITSRRIKEGKQEKDFSRKASPLFNKPKKTNRVEHVEKANEVSRYFQISRIKNTKALYICARNIEKDLKIPLDLILSHYFWLNAIPVSVASFLSGKSERVITNAGQIEKVAGDVVKENKINLVRIWREFDQDGKPKSGTGILAVRLDRKFFDYMSEIHKKKGIS